MHVQWRLNRQFLEKSSPPRGDRNRLGFFSELSLANEELCVSRTRKPLPSACPVAETLQASAAVEGDSNEPCLWLESQGSGRTTPSPSVPVSLGGREIGRCASSPLPSHHALPDGLAPFLVTTLPAPFMSLYFPNPCTVPWCLILPSRTLPSPHLHLQDVFFDYSSPALPSAPTSFLIYVL